MVNLFLVLLTALTKLKALTRHIFQTQEK